MLFTPANAAEMARRGAITRRLRYGKRKPFDYSPTVLTEATTPYVTSQVARVRDMIEKVADMLDKAKDPLDIDRLARALSVLRKDERELDGRPLPGSRRPGKERSTGTQDVAPI